MKVWAYYGRIGDEGMSPGLFLKLFTSREAAYQAAFDDLLDELLFEDELAEALEDYDPEDDDAWEEMGNREKFESLDFSYQMLVLQAVADSVSYNIDRIYDYEIEEVEVK